MHMHFLCPSHAKTWYFTLLPTVAVAYGGYHQRLRWITPLTSLPALSTKADIVCTPTTRKGAAHAGLLQEALHPQGNWGRAGCPGLGWTGAPSPGWVHAGPSWGCSGPRTGPNNYFQTTNSLSLEMASCKWNSRASEKVVNKSFSRRIEERGNKPPPFLTLSESCSAMNCL